MRFTSIIVMAFAAIASAKTEKDCRTPGATMCSDTRHDVMECRNGKWEKTSDCKDIGLHCDMGPSILNPQSLVASCYPKKDD